MIRIKTFVAAVCMFLMAAAAIPSPAFAAGSFSDVSEKSPEFAAVEFLKAKGIMQGYPTGRISRSRQ